MNENSETGYIFGTKVLKPVEGKGIFVGTSWSSGGQVPLGFVSILFP